MRWQEATTILNSLNSDNNGVLRAREWVRKHAGGKYGVPTPKSVTFEDDTVFVTCDNKGWVFYPNGNILFAGTNA